MSEYSHGWSTRVIEEICDIHDYRRIPLSSEERRERKGPYPYYGANNIQDRIDDFIFDFDAVLIAEDGGYYDEHEYRDIAQYATGKYWVNNHAHILTGKPGLDTRFLYYALVRKNICPWINTGTRSKLNQSDLKQIELLVPPLPEQKKIAEILSGIDTEINCLKEQTERCLRILLTISEDVFHKCKSKFPSQDLTQVCSVITKGATPTTFGYELSGIRFPGSVTFLGGGSTSDLGEFNQNPARYCAPEAVGTLKRSELRAGDTLITIVGASIGNTCQIPGYALPANINQNVALVRSNEAVLDCDYLSLYLKTEGRKALINIATTQAQPSVSLKQVGELQIPMPPTNEQRRISEAVTSIRNWKIQLERKMHTMAHLKQALSSDLLSGRKRVSI